MLPCPLSGRKELRQSRCRGRPARRCCVSALVARSVHPRLGRRFSRREAVGLLLHFASPLEGVDVRKVEMSAPRTRQFRRTEQQGEQCPPPPACTGLAFPRSPQEMPFPRRAVLQLTERRRG